MKYGKYEYERIYLLENNCLIGKNIRVIKKIKDKYIEGTNLRLREVVESNDIKYKLTQKEKLSPTKQGILKINTLYLSKTEFDKLNILEGVEIKKERHIIQIDQLKIGVDKIILDKECLFIAEVEFETELEMNDFSMPISNIMEITGELKYSGYELAKEYSRK